MGEKNTIRMNPVDFTYFALEDVVTAGGQLAIVRFSEKHDASEIRTAMRAMFTLYPRMRSVVEPTLFSYRVRVLEDSDIRTESLFNDSFRVVRNIQCGTPEFEEYKRYFYNEPFALEQGFPIKVRYLPDGETPVLLLFINHATSDGLGMIHLAGSIMAFLNGRQPAAVPASSNSFFPAYLERPFYKVPRQLVRSFNVLRKEMKKSRQGKILQPSSKAVKFFGSVDNYNHYLSYSLDDILKKARGLGCSINAILMAALVVTVARERAQDTGDVIALPMPVDLRPYFPEGRRPVFGNFAAAIMIRIRRELWGEPFAIIDEIRAQSANMIAILKNRDALFGLIVDTLMMGLGRKIYSGMARRLKEKGILAKTAAFSNVGNVDHLNSHGDRAKVLEYVATTNSHGLFMAFFTMNNRIRFGITYQEAEFSRDDIKGLMEKYDAVLVEFMRLKKTGY